MFEYTIPNVPANINGHDCNLDLFSDEFHKRKIFLNGEINSASARLIMSEINYLAAQSDDDIYLYINSPGGSVTDGMPIYDLMKYGIHCDVVTVATGMAASMGAFLLAAGTKGKRYAFPNAEIMIHQPLGGISGQATDIFLVAERITQLKHKLANILSDESNHPVEKLLHDMERDYWMTAEDCKAYGLIDHIGIPEII